MSIINDVMRIPYNLIKRKNLKNKTFSLICNNCTGSFILKDLNIRYNSPFINLWIKPDDYLKLCSKLKYYLSYDLKETFEKGIDYPIGKLKDINIYFMHYYNFEEAYLKWNQRKERIDYDNIFFLFIDKDYCTKDIICKYDNLSINKKILTYRKDVNSSNIVFIDNCISESGLGDIYIDLKIR